MKKPFGIRLRFFLTILISSILMFGLINTALLKVTEQIIGNIISQDQQALAENLLHQIDYYIFRRYIDLDILANNTDFPLAFNKEITSDEKSGISLILSQFVEKSALWDVVRIIKADDRTFIASSKSQDNQEAVTDDAEYNKAIDNAINGKFYISDALLISQSPTILISVPIRNLQNSPNPIVGVLVGQLSWDPILEILAPVKNVTIHIINQNGLVLASNLESHNSHIFEKNFSTNRVIKELLAGKEGTIIEKSLDSSGESLQTYIYQKGYLDYKGHKWGMIYEMSKDRAFLPLEQATKWIFFLSTTIIIVGAVFLLLAIQRLVVNPIDKLTSASQQIVLGNYGYQIPGQSKDEIGLLTRTFNNMSQALANYAKTMEQKVKEKTQGMEEQLKKESRQMESLERTKLAMMNLLDDAKQLEEQLKKEKEGVEEKVKERTKELRDARDKISDNWWSIQKEKARLTASINSLRIGFVMIDMDYNVMIINPVTNKILGKSDDESKIWTFPEIDGVFKKSISLKESVSRCLSSRESYTADNIEYNDKFIRLFVAPISMSEGEIIGAVILFEDITEAKRLERTRDEFFAVASHELRTPLTAIRGNTALIQQYFSDALKDQDLKDMIKDMHESAVRLTDLVNDFLDVSKLEQNKITFKVEPFDIIELCQKSLHDFDAALSQKKLNITLNKKEEKVMVMADSEKCQQIIYNLIGNSLKFTPENGKITVSVEKKDQLVLICVEDTGSGIPKENQYLLFRKFQQAGSSFISRDVTRGSGLGLYISRLMAEGMKGNIYLVRSEVGIGSVFCLELPIAA